jgi:hypothetical protein
MRLEKTWKFIETPKFRISLEQWNWTLNLGRSYHSLIIEPNFPGLQTLDVFGFRRLIIAKFFTTPVFSLAAPVTAPLELTSLSKDNAGRVRLPLCFLTVKPFVFCFQPQIVSFDIIFLEWVCTLPTPRSNDEIFSTY